MDYCTTFHWECLLDPMYLIGLTVIVLLETCIVVGAFALASTFIYWIVINFYDAIRNGKWL